MHLGVRTPLFFLTDYLLSTVPIVSYLWSCLRCIKSIFMNHTVLCTILCQKARFQSVRIKFFRGYFTSNSKHNLYIYYKLRQALNFYIWQSWALNIKHFTNMLWSLCGSANQKLWILLLMARPPEWVTEPLSQVYI